MTPVRMSKLFDFVRLMTILSPIQAFYTSDLELSGCYYNWNLSTAYGNDPIVGSYNENNNFVVHIS